MCGPKFRRAVCLLPVHFFLPFPLCAVPLHDWPWIFPSVYQHAQCSAVWSRFFAQVYFTLVSFKVRLNAVHFPTAIGPLVFAKCFSTLLPHITPVSHPVAQSGLFAKFSLKSCCMSMCPQICLQLRIAVFLTLDHSNRFKKPLCGAFIGTNCPAECTFFQNSHSFILGLHVCKLMQIESITLHLSRSTVRIVLITYVYAHTISEP